jgi:type I restriction enzyme S subunit
VWLVPALRFPEFTEEWEEHYLAEYLDFKNGLNPSANKFGSGIKFISVMDILNNDFITYDCIRTSVEITPEEQVAFAVEKGDMLFQRSSETLEDVGRANVYMDDRPAVFGGFVIRGKKKAEYNPMFFRYLLASPYARKKVIPMGAGAQHFNIGQDGLSKVKLHFPILQEQQKIADLLRLINERISTQNKIIEKLETLIKGIVETVISSQKPNTLIKNCLECNSSTLQESQVAETGTFPVYGATDISGYTETAGINGESILIIKDGSGVGTVKFVSGEYSYIGTLNSLTAKDGYCLKYIYFALQRFSFEPYKTGMAIPHIYFKDYGKAKIYCPSFSLQTLIAQKLSLIENKMEVEKRIILCYQLQRSYLLSRMFI